MSARHRVALLLVVPGFAAGVGAVTYADRAPLLAARCTACHTGPNAPRGLHLDSDEGLVAGSVRGPVAGDVAGSELAARLRGISQPRMPLTGPPYLDEEEIGGFVTWVESGLPRGAAGLPGVAPPASWSGSGEQVTWRHVAPLFATRAARCHAMRRLMGGPPEGFVLTSQVDAVTAGERARVIPGKPGASELPRRLRGQVAADGTIMVERLGRR